MSIASEITRLQTAKADIKAAIEAQGVTVPSATLLSGYDDLIAAIQTGGGSGATEVASGTFTPSSTALSLDVAIGKKMAQADFILVVYADNETEVPYDTTYKGLIGTIICDKALGYYDLQTDGNKSPVGKLVYKLNQSGTITDKTVDGIYGGSYQLRNATSGTFYPGATHNKITRSSSGFTFTLRWTSQNFMSGYTYNYKILYYGSDPTNDIVEVA